jgi:hypothetical protein
MPVLAAGPQPALQSRFPATEASMRTLAAFLLIGASIAQAQNLVPNPDFDTGIDGWSTLSNGTIEWVADDGSPDPGALRLRLADARGNGTEALSGCFAVDPSMHHDLAASLKLIAGIEAHIFFVVYDNPTCADPPVGGADYYAQVPTADGLWHDVMVADIPLAPEAVAARIFIGTGAPYPDTNAVALADHIAFGPTGSVPVTLQSFGVE